MRTGQRVVCTVLVVFMGLAGVETVHALTCQIAADGHCNRPPFGTCTCPKR